MNLSYRTYRIPKGKSGKFRKISEPNEELKAWQLGVLKKLYEVKPHLVNHGFVPSKSIATNAKPHVGKTNVLSLDIEKFFPNTNKTKVSKILKEKFPEYENVIERFLLNGSLPQGAPTSPYIANFALDRFDEIIYEYTQLNNISYTRYADDLTFSWIGKIDLKVFLSFLNENLRESKYRFAKRKTKLMHKSKRQIVTGIIVNEKLNIPYEVRNNLRAYNHLIETDNFEKSKINWVNGLNGYLNMKNI
tara:strand:- start:27978 stop:28718 length:741 start_codon:yes stop_codon:yes gene_type:complete